MRLRSELDAFSQTIAATNWDGTESIHFSVPTKHGQEEISSISTMCSNLSARVNAFVKKDKSLQGRIDTLSQVSSALGKIANIVHVQKPWFKRILSYFGFFLTAEETKIYSTKAKVDSLVSKYQYKYIRVHVGEGIIWRILNVFGLTLRNLILQGASWQSESSKGKMIMNAFRVVKLESMLSGVLIDPSFSGGHFSEVSKGLRQDLEEFQSLFSQSIKDKIAPFIRSLQLAGKIGDHLTAALALTKMKKGDNKIPFIDIDHFERRVKHEQRDLAYEIEKFVQTLPIGDGLIIPCGYGDASGGHAVATTIKKMQNATYTIACHNTGDGAEAAQGLFGFFKMLYKWQIHLPTFENVPLKTAVKQRMLTKLLDLTKDSYWQPVYKLRPFMAKKNIQDVLKNSIELQTWGTCSYDSIMSCLSHDMPPSIFLVFQLFMMQKAHRNIQKDFPDARESKLFNDYTLNLLRDSPQKNIDSHINLCQDFFGKFLENEHNSFANEDELKMRIQTTQSKLASLEAEEASYNVSFLTLGRSGLADIQEKIKIEKEFFTSLRGIITIATPPGAVDHILNKTDQEFAAYLLSSDLKTIVDYKNTVQELADLFESLTEAA